MNKPAFAALALAVVVASACIAPPEYGDHEPHVRSVAVEFDQDSAPSESSFVVSEKRVEPAPAAPLPTTATDAEPTDALPIIDADHPPVSLRSRAEAAIGSGDLDTAATHYAAWLRADPTDANSWYNLACAEALRGNHERAMTAFTSSLLAGFDSLDHARRDTDLDAIRGDLRFEEALVAAEERLKTRTLPGMSRHHVVTETAGTYAVLVPEKMEEGRTYPVCVILHGSGSDELSHGRVSTEFGRDDVVYILPRALHAHVGATISRGEGGWAVWPPEETGPDIRPMTLHVDWIFRCVDDAAKRYPVDVSKVAIWGHSQGAAAAIASAALRPERVATICAYAGYTPGDEVTDERIAAMVREGVVIHLLHSKDDRVVPAEETTALRDRIVAASGDVDVVLYAEGGHALHDQVRERSRRWLRDFAHSHTAR